MIKFKFISYNLIVKYLIVILVVMADPMNNNQVRENMAELKTINEDLKNIYTRTRDILINLVETFKANDHLVQKEKETFQAYNLRYVAISEN